MRPLFDSHAHFDSFGETEADDLIARARAAGVERILAVGGTPAANRRVLALSARHAPRVLAAAGYDRDQASPLADDEAVARAVAALRGELRACAGEARAVCAVGEIGLDLHYSPETASRQVALMRAQLGLAAELGLPVVVHSRDAEQATLRLLREHAARWGGPPGRIGVLHCFTGSAAFAEGLVELGFHIGFSGIVSFANAGGLREVARLVPAGKLLIETDTPYLAPVPHRGRRNEPAYLVHVAEALAAARGSTPDETADITRRNAAFLFEGRAPST